MSVTIADFGKATDGTTVKAATLKNDQIEVEVLSYAAILHKIIVKNRRGEPVDVVLGYQDTHGYELNNNGMGAVIGRFANRIGGAKFMLYENEYHVTPNENGNCLHSGLHGFGHSMFKMAQGEDDTLVLTATSPDGTDGFPGKVELEVQYSLSGCGLVIQYTATTDAPTVINMTNHSYFNLNGHASGTVLGHRLALDATAYLETDGGSIPTGRRIPVAHTPMDFNEEKTIGRDIGADYPALTQGHGYDHCYLVPKTGLRHIAWLTGPETGIRMETLSTLPGVQLYTANFLDGDSLSKAGTPYGKNAAVCLETQDYPDAPNHPDFPDTTLLPDEPYSATTIYRFDLAPQ